MARKKKEPAVRRRYSKDLKRRVIYQSTILGKSTMKIAKSLDMNIRVVQRVVLTWDEIGEVCRDRTRLGRAPLMTAASVDVSTLHPLLWYSSDLGIAYAGVDRACP
jgi:hypothetical protein